MTGTEIAKAVMMNGGWGGFHIRLKNSVYRCSNKSVLVLNGNGFCFGNQLDFLMLLFILSVSILLVKGYIYFDKHAVVKKST